MDNYLPGTEVIARGLKWHVVESQPLGEQLRVRLRGQGAFAGFEVDVLTPFEQVDWVIHELDPTRAGTLANWIVYHQAFLLEQALGPDAFLAVQPGRLRIEPYQLVPLARSLRMSRPRLLLADDVGLGKTIEAGLIIAELMARRRVHRLLIVTPAGPLLEQWQTEMAERFGLRLEEADRATIDRIRRSTELGANPFDHLPIVIASMDFLKQDRVLDEVERALPYDLVVIDEAHHYSETGANEIDRTEASQRRRLGEVLARQSDALLLLTATPHDGYDRSFASLLELLDPSLVDGKGRAREEAYRPHVVRRLKKHVKIMHPKTGEYISFPERQLLPIQVSADSVLHPEYVSLHRSLLGFIATALRKSLRTKQYDDALAYLALLKRSTSTVLALRNTVKAVLDRMQELATAKQEEIESRQQRRKSLRAMQRRTARFGTLTLDEEIEHELLEKEELAQQLSLLERESGKASREAERVESASQTLANILQKADAALSHDLKLDELVAQVQRIRKDEPQANILIYTEYVDSLRQVEQRLTAEGTGKVLTIHGMAREVSVSPDETPNRRAITEQFRNNDNLVLVSTDAAAEGLNLHERCHHLIHLELPWNPNRLEQRNGRIDRYGQWHAPVIRYLYLCGTFEERILARLTAKYEKQRDRLKFMPNTLGIDPSGLPEDGLFAVLAQGEDTIGNPCRRFHLAESADDPDDPDVNVLLEEIESSLNHFENVAKTYKWLGDEGAAADAVSQQQARRAFEIGRKIGNVDLIIFVEGAVLAAGGTVRHKEHWIDFHLPKSWVFGMEGLPGWNGERLRLTTDLALLTDNKNESVGFLGRAHPLVRRSIEHVRHSALGQGDGLDHRVSAMHSPNGRPALVFTFLGSVQSRIGRELERVIAVRVSEDLQPQLLSDSAEWIPQPDDGIATKGLWAQSFKIWTEAAISVAQAIGNETVEQIAHDFAPKHQRLLAQERQELSEWFEQRVGELLGKGEVDLPLFRGVAVANQSPVERLTEFIARVNRSSREHSEAQTLLKLYGGRMDALNARELTGAPLCTLLGGLMQK